MPFLVDSTSMEVNRQGLTLHLIFHPMFAVRRNEAGELLELQPRAAQPEWPRESFIHLEVDRVADPVARAGLAEGIERVLSDVRAAVTDWKAMVAKLREVIRELDERPPPVPREELAESRALLQWLTEDHMLLLGYRCNDLRERDGELELVRGDEAGLGILRETRRAEGDFDQLFDGAAGDARARDVALAVPAGDQGDHTVHRAPPGLRRLRRRQALR